MKIQGNPGPDRITITFEDGEFKGRSVTMDAEPLVGGIVLYANSIKDWDGSISTKMDLEAKKKVIELIRIELKHYPPSEIVE